MIAYIRGSKLPLKAFGLSLGISILFGSVATAQDNVPVVPSNLPVVRSNLPPVTQPYTGIHLFPGPPSAGSLGYGPPGIHEGYQGFGLGYHLGYGYGGDALGPGADGGYPFYGGPGYPHCNPQLRRIGGIVPFPYFGGAGYPTPDHPNFYGGTGELVPDRPVVSIIAENGQPVMATDFGSFTGAVPDAEARFAPFTARAAAGAALMRRSQSRSNLPAPTGPETGLTPPKPSTNPSVGGLSEPPRARQFLGIEAEPATDAAGVRGMKITKIHPGSAAERVGLHEGDVIRSINDYTTQLRGNLEWIYVNAAPNNILKMNVFTPGDGKEHAYTTQIP